MFPIDTRTLRILCDLEQERLSSPHELRRAEWRRQQDAARCERWRSIARWLGARLAGAGEHLLQGAIGTRASPQEPVRLAPRDRRDEKPPTA